MSGLDLFGATTSKPKSDASTGTATKVFVGAVVAVLFGALYLTFKG